MTYNLLSYDVSADRDIHFRTVIAAANPDVLVVQEIRSQTGVNNFLNNVVNAEGVGSYVAGPYIDGYDTDRAIFYKSNKSSVLSNRAIRTALRDINEFTLVNARTNDTLLIYGVHLKASAGSDNEARRTAEVDILRGVTNALPRGRNFIVLGDFNIYGSQEAAYQKLVQVTPGSDGHFVDPLSMPGTWNQSAYASYHTQSTRTRSFGGGATWGLDDRFDMILHSRALGEAGGVRFIPGSYLPFGNDGNHYNDSINKVPNSAVSQSVANALHSASDHLPVVASFLFEGTPQFTISGNTEASGVTLNYVDGTPKSVTSGGGGNYSLSVPNNWSGTVTPAKSGYSFTPSSYLYSNVLSNRSNQNYSATALSDIAISGNTGISGVMVSYVDGTAKSVLSDANGNYSLAVSHGWSGTIIPARSGFSFSPPSYTYSNVVSHQINQNFLATVLSLSISGKAGTGNVTFSYADGSIKNVSSDGNGNYALMVSYGWSGSVTPSKNGFTFSPALYSYSNVVSDITNKNHVATPLKYVISGNVGQAGVVMSYTDGNAKSVTSDENGNYFLSVSYNWSGMVVPSKSGFSFTPANFLYTNVLSNRPNQNYSISVQTFAISGNVGLSGVTLRYTEGSPKSVLSEAGGDFSIRVPQDWSGTITPAKIGYDFAPTSLTFYHVQSDKVDQNYSPIALTNVSFQGGVVASQLRLHSNYPNPFNPSTVIRYEIPAIVDVSLRIHDVLGREVAVLVDGMNEAGVFHVTWNAQDLPTGLYLLRMTAGTFVETRKMLLVK